MNITFSTKFGKIILMIVNIYTIQISIYNKIKNTNIIIMTLQNYSIISIDEVGYS